MSEQILKDTDPNTFDVEKDDFCVVGGVRYEVGLVGDNESDTLSRRIILIRVHDSCIISVAGGHEKIFISKLQDTSYTQWRYHKPRPKKTMRPMNAKEMYALIREGRLFRPVEFGVNADFTFFNLFAFIDNMYKWKRTWYAPELLEYLDDDLNPVPCMVEEEAQ